MQDETMEEFRDRIVRYHGGDFDTAFQKSKERFREGFAHDANWLATGLG